MEWLMKYSRLWVCLALFCSPAVSRAQSVNPSDSTDVIRALLARVEQLEKRVAELEGRAGPSAAGAPPVAAVEPTRAPDTIAGAPNQVVEAPQVHMGHG